MALTVHGNVSFGRNAPESIPKGSHLVVKFEDVSLADAPSVTLGETIIDAHEAYSMQTKGSERSLSYSITFERPSAFGHMYSVSAVLNIGWKASGDEWIRRGDYLTDTAHSVQLENNKNDYEKDIELVLYS